MERIRTQVDLSGSGIIPAPEQILQGFLRELWMEAVRRRQGELPAASTPENDAARLRYSTLIRKLQRSAWNTARALMCADTLG